MKINLLLLKNCSIFRQLKIEEALLRTNEENWCIINIGSPEAIVMGVSGDPKQLIDLEKIAQSPVPVIRRFSGGGTVFVDQETIFVSFLFQKKAHPFPAFPEHLLKWSTSFYQSALVSLDTFELHENDYTLGNKKIGGNAQYLRKDRWLHHTTFLYDFKSENMNYLKFPPKVPIYREKRSHDAFLTKLRKYFGTKEEVTSAIVDELSRRYEICRQTLDEVTALPFPKHRSSTEYITPPPPII